MSERVDYAHPEERYPPGFRARRGLNWGSIGLLYASFYRKERGRFAGIFGFMINLGRFGINSLVPAILGGFVIFGVIHVPAKHWRWVFIAPAFICAFFAVLMALAVKESPEQAGFHR